MGWPKGKARPAAAGRKPGTPNKRTLEIAEYARRIVEDEKVRAMVLLQAQNGSLPPAVLVLFYHYAFGKPVERVEHGGPDGGAIAFEDLTALSALERARRIAELEAKRRRAE
jgi:hypothetical protein